MAAAGFNWSGGRGSGRRTIGLVLLSFPLVCFSSLLSGRDLLAQIKNNVQTGMQNMEKLKDICKSEEAVFRYGINEHMSLLDHFIALERDQWRDSPVFPLVDMHLNDIKGSAENTKAQVEKQIEMIREEMKDIEDELKEQLRLVKCLEEGRGPCVRVVDPFKDKGLDKLVAPFDIASLKEFMENIRVSHEKITSNTERLREEFGRRRKITLEEIAELPKMFGVNATRRYPM